MVNFSMGTGNFVLPYRPDIPLGGQSGRSKLAKSRAIYLSLARSNGHAIVGEERVQGAREAHG